MANITVRENAGLQNQREREREWDPIRRLGDLLRWDPFREMSPYLGQGGEASMFTPAFEVAETKSAYVFKADLPGVKEEDVDISHIGNRLTISGSREAEREDKADTYYAYERSYGNFTRSFTLPEGIDVDHIRAELKHGVLTLLVPKTPQAQPKKISLKGLFEKGEKKQ